MEATQRMILKIVLIDIKWKKVIPRPVCPSDTYSKSGIICNQSNPEEQKGKFFLHTPTMGDRDETRAK